MLAERVIHFREQWASDEATPELRSLLADWQAIVKAQARIFDYRPYLSIEPD